MTDGQRQARDEPNSGETFSDRAALARHGGGFIASGLFAFMVDALMLWLLTRFGGLDPFTARVLAISVAMVAAWASHRRLTFNVRTPPSLNEFLRFAAVAWTAAAINYAIYAGILLAISHAPPLVALVAATAVSMVFSYLGMRFRVFTSRS